MQRVSLTNGNSGQRGVLLDNTFLTTIFPVATIESGYAGEQNNSISLNQTVNLLTKTIWGYDFHDGNALLNKKVTKRWTDSTGIEQEMELASMQDSDQTIRVTLQVKDFGTAISKNKAYTAKEAGDKVKLSDWIFGGRTYLTEHYANFAKEAREMRNLVVNKATELGLITKKSQAIDFRDARIQEYYKQEIAVRYQALQQKYSLAALIGDSNSPLYGAQVYRKDDGFGSRYTLYLS